jgi:acyl carrier protein
MSSPDPFATFPSFVREAHARWLSAHDLAALDTVVLAIVGFHRSRRGPLDLTSRPPDSARLVADLGYDSLALAEVVFFIEDIYRVSISNHDLRLIHTVADLRAYVRTKVGTS